MASRTQIKSGKINIDVYWYKDGDFDINDWIEDAPEFQFNPDDCDGMTKAKFEKRIIKELSLYRAKLQKYIADLDNAICQIEENEK